MSRSASPFTEPSPGAASSRRWGLAAVVTICLACVQGGFATSSHAAEDATKPANGYPNVYAIKDAKVIVAPGKVHDQGTVVVRGGLIEAVGPSAEVAIPFDAEIIEGKGLFIYPGFIDLYTTVGQPSGVERSITGRGRPVELSETPLATTPADNRRGLTPEFEVADSLDLNQGVTEPRRKLGFTDLLSAPSGAIVTGQSAFVSLSGLPRREAVLKSPVALHVHLATPTDPPARNEGPSTPAGGRRRPGQETGGTENPYPRSLMGSIAHFRQAMLDADHYQALLAYEEGAGQRMPFDPALKALNLARTGKLPVWWEANTRDEIHRALDIAREFGTSAVIVGGEEASKVVDRLKAEKVSVVFRLNFPDKPSVPSVEDFQKKPVIDREEPLKVLAERERKWKERVATAATLAKEGIPVAFATEGIDKIENFPAKVRAVIAGGLTSDQALAALTSQAATIAGVDRRLGTIEPGKLGHVVVMTAPFDDEKAKVKSLLIDGLKFEVKPPQAEGAEGRPSGDRRGGPPASRARGEAAEKKEEPSPKSENPDAKTESSEEKEKPKTDTEKPKPDEKATPGSEKKDEPKTPPAPFVDVLTEFDADRVPRIKTGGTVLIKDATILTVANGTIPKGSILIENGKIKAVGPDVTAGPDVQVIDASGLVAMPGIIDTHSHIAIQGGVNEMSLSVVPEVRVKDVVTGDDVDIYRALAGGTTTARLLHGSANTIGGQDAVIKLKYGLPARDLILRDNPQGVKFALGENVTRSRGRFPNSRMGVESVIERAFEEAKAYRAEWARYEAAAKADKAKAGPSPRKDLRLDALARILEGSIKIHSHCYRSDEILMLLRTAEKYGVRVQSLQHVLEGYKVAAEIVAHGASTSTFSDWWAYKIEAYDAIPFNAALLSQAGANVCIKSDSEELIRHLNLEAAKMVKYGGATEEKALAMVTLNPARELGLDQRLGSIEVGKDADLALFNGHPFDAFSRCELSLIDGEVYFQRVEPDGKFGVRPGEHLKMPQAAEMARNRLVEFTSQPKETFALLGATLHPVTGPAIPNGVLVVTSGKISLIGPAGTAVPPEAQTIDLTGLDLWPGLIDAGSNLGLAEIGSLTETQDHADASRFEPELRASTALRADSEHIPVTRANGVLSAYVQPDGGLISGQGCVINLNGWVPRELVVKDQAALNVTIPAYIPRPLDGQQRRGPGQGGQEGGQDPRERRKEQLEELREQFRKAARYGEIEAKAREIGAMPPPFDPRLSALAPYAKGEKPVIFQANRRNEILDALAIAKDLKLKAVISGATDAWKVAREIKEAGVPVLVSGTLIVPDQPHDPYDAAYANPAKLHEAGVTIAIQSQAGGASTTMNARNLPFEAATAVAFGLPEDEALRAVTLNPARILGMDDRLGSLETGKCANLVVTAGHLLQPTTPVLALFINGRHVTPESRHTRLYAKYQQRLEEVRAGVAPLGLERPVSSPAQSAGRGAATASPAAP